MDDSLPPDLTDGEARILYRRAKPRPYTEAEIDRLVAHTVERAANAEPLSDLEACVEQFAEYAAPPSMGPRAIMDQANRARRELAVLRLEALQNGLRMNADENAVWDSREVRSFRSDRLDARKDQTP